MQRETAEKVGTERSPAVLTWRDRPTPPHGHELRSHGKDARRGDPLKMKVLAAIRAYFGHSPVPMRTVFFASGLLSTIFVFTSFIGRTQLGTAPERFDWLRQAPGPYLNFFAWAMLLPLVALWSKRWPLKGHPIWRPLVIHFVLGLLLSCFHECSTTAVFLLFLKNMGYLQWSPELFNNLLLSIPGGVVQRFIEYSFLLMLLIYMETHRQVREERTRVLQLQNELQTTQLLTLKKQLQPHFLFNALNTVSALMDEDSKSARTVLARLGQLLRTTLDEERTERVLLIQEVDHVGDYLGIETIRFKDRLQVHYDIPAECQGALVPGMMLQPLVENSIKHGLDHSADRMEITIEAMKRQNDLLLRVADNGRGCSDPKEVFRNGGIGLRNVRERLSLLYGKNSDMVVTSSPGKGFSVTITIPYDNHGFNLS